MRLVDRTGPGTLGLNYMWLPTWIGLNAQLVKEIEDAIAPEIVGSLLTEKTLDKADAAVLRFLTKKFPQIPGLFDYIDGLKYVTSTSNATA